jgi:hypothetical protein
MLKLLLHWWRLLTTESGAGRLFGISQPRGWRVRYAAEKLSDGTYVPSGLSIPMAYDTACDYAKIFGGTVERANT